MGTNYYAHIKVIDEDIEKLKKDTQKFGIDFCCFDNYPIHLGKSSIGWKFHLQYHEGKYYRNWYQMKEWLKDKIIEDEYHHVIPLQKFIAIVEYRKNVKEPQSPEEFAAQYHRRAFTIEGYVFYDFEFS